MNATSDKWLGFVVMARAPTLKQFKQVSIAYDTRAGAEAFLTYYKRFRQDVECFVTEKVRGAK